jgi:DNA recombination protein RmuC
MKEKISDFEKKVESTYQTESKERISLQEQVKQLMSLNTQLNDEAQKLSRALKSDSKKQGNWGEFILEKILEYSGLVKDREYVTQYSTTDENNTRLQPDVVISLPDNKHLVIDSKVSLTAYERLVNAEDDVTRELALREHLASIRSHIKNLSEKNYNNASGINSPDFVLLFMPIESSFGVAVEADNQLFKYAWEQKIVVVSPSTLLATLKTVHSLWRQEKQNINAVRIATDAGNLYDKFVGLVDDLVKLGNQLKTVQGTYDSSFNKLKSGSGNIIGRIEKIRKLGAKTSKKITPDLTDEAMDFFDDEHEEEQEQKIEE